MYLVVFIDFAVAFNCIYSTSILSRMFGDGDSKHSAMVFADSMSGRVFIVIRSIGTLTMWYTRGFGQGSRGSGLLYKASSRVIPSLLYPDCMYPMFADD